MDISKLDSFLNGSYYLDENDEVQPATNREQSLRSFQDLAKKIVKQEWVGMNWLSTVFLGLDHSFGGSVPILWESMTFSNVADDERHERCGGQRADALHMHESMKEHLFSSMTEEERLMHFSLTVHINEIVGLHRRRGGDFTSLVAPVARIVPPVSLINGEIERILNQLNDFQQS